MPPISRLRSALPSKVLSARDKRDWALTLIAATVIPLYGFYELFSETGGARTNERVRLELMANERDHLEVLDAIEERGRGEGEGRAGPVLIER